VSDDELIDCRDWNRAITNELDFFLQKKTTIASLINGQILA